MSPAEKAHYDRTVEAARQLSQLAKQHLPSGAVVLMIVGLKTDDHEGFPIVLAGNVHGDDVVGMLDHAAEQAERALQQQAPAEVGRVKH